MVEINKNIPVIFQKLNSFETEDSRFLQVKIWLMHLNENLNGSFFSKEVVEDAIPTLANTPILAYIEQNSKDEDDFSDHRNILVKDDGQYKIKYIGQAIGVIPETNNAQFEMRLCDDGIEREFLTVEGLVWQDKWDDAPDILNRDKIKPQSMELHKDYEGEWGEDNLFHFTKFKFYGACGLGMDYMPAMHNASIEVQFSADSFKQDIQKKMEEFKQFTLHQSSQEVDNINSQEGGMTVNEKLELLNKYNLTQEQLQFSIDEMSLEELDAKLKEVTKPEFTLTGEQFIEELRIELSSEKIKDEWDWEYSRYSYVDYKENMVFAYDRQNNWKLYGFNFTLQGDKITIDFTTAKRKKFEIVDFEEGQAVPEFELFPKDAIDYQVNVKEKELTKKFTEEKEFAVNEVKKELDDVNGKFTVLETEAQRLRDFEKQTLDEARKVAEEELFAQYEKLNGVEEFEELKKNAANFTVEALEKECALIYVKKNANFTANKKTKSTVKIPLGLDDKNDDQPYGDIFNRYLKK